MNTELQRIAIAEACGWKPKIAKMYAGQRNVKVWEKLEGGYKKTFGSCYSFPDYLNDLNAMHEVEKMADREFYAAQLLAVIHEVDADYFNRLSWQNGHELATATAAQRAEAFLKTIGKWTE